MHDTTEKALTTPCICGADPGKPNPDCERCDLVAEVLRLRRKVEAVEERDIKKLNDWWICLTRRHGMTKHRTQEEAVKSLWESFGITPEPSEPPQSAGPS